MIYIDFYTGLHGHFLEYSINALDDTVKKFDPFTKFGTSHGPFPKPLAVADHYSHHNIPISGDIISIVADENDCLLVNLLCIGRGADCNFKLDTFEKNFGSQLRGTPYYRGFRESLLHYDIDIDLVDSVPRGILRESIKYNFADPKTNSFMQHVYNMKHTKHSLNVHVKSLYDEDAYIALLQQIIQYFNMPYTVDRPWFLDLLSRFKEKNVYIDQEKDSLDVLQNVIELTNRSIKFNVIQEAWLNAELENHFGIEMPPEQEQYFSDTDSINKYLKRL
jgi:hypothetical protein